MSAAPKRKYLGYALGEIILVVLGILIALQINNWNQNQINNKEEQRILSTISSEIDTLSWKSLRGLQTYTDIVQSTELLLLHINDPTMSLSADSIKYHLAVITNQWMLGNSNNTNVYDVLAAAGELGLLKSDDLRNTLSTIDRQILLLSVYETFQTEYVNQALFPYLSDYVDEVELNFIRDKYVEETWDLKTISVELTLKKSRFESQLNELLDSRKFSNLLVSHNKKSASLLPIYHRLISHLEQVSTLTKESIH